jgi:hypothetical protein
MGADIPPRSVCDTSPCDIKTGIVGFTPAVNGEILSLKKIVNTAETRDGPLERPSYPTDRDDTRGDLVDRDSSVRRFERLSEDEDSDHE